MVAYGGRDDGLFSAGVMQSGNPAAWRALNGTDFYQDLYYNVTVNVHPSSDFAAAHNMASTDPCSVAADSLACLRTGSLEELNAVFNGSRDISQKWFPVVDGDFLQEYPSRQLNRGEFVKIPILSGTSTNEGHWFVPPINTTEQFYTYLLRKSPTCSVSSQLAAVCISASLIGEIFVADLLLPTYSRPSGLHRQTISTRLATQAR